jgi:hypothetical protein
MKKFLGNVLPFVFGVILTPFLLVGAILIIWRIYDFSYRFWKAVLW